MKPVELRQLTSSTHLRRTPRPLSKWLATLANRSAAIVFISVLSACSGADQPESQADVTQLVKQGVGQVVEAHLDLSTRVLGQEDLPPEGTRSLFDHFATQNNGVPYPFEKLIESLTGMNPEGKPPVVVMIPDGRSLLKGQANFEKPRVLVAADFQVDNSPATLGVNMRGQMFLGFTENADEIEVLSYNEAAGRFEFQLVQEYSATGSRKLVYAKRPICLTCHQGGAPIFSQRPWSETNAASGTIQAMLNSRDKAGLDTQTYLGLPLTAPLSEPERYDELTDVASFITATQKVWLDGCGEGEQAVQCRKTLLKEALKFKAEPGSYSDQSESADQLRALQTAALGSQKIAVAESDLVNRDPQAEKQGIKAFFRQFTSASVRLGEGAKNNEDLEAFNDLPRLPVNLDPLTKREPKRLLGGSDIDGVYGLASLMTDSDIDLLMKRADYRIQNLEQAVEKLPDDLFVAAQFQRIKLLQALLESSELNGQPLHLAYAFTDVSEMSPPIASGEPPLALSEGSELKTFEAYCFSCHRGNPSRKLNFMSGPDEATVQAKIKETTAIRDALDWDRYRNTDKASMLMPPTDSVQYAKLVNDLKNNPALLEQMRDQVPSLFGF